MFLLSIPRLWILRACGPSAVAWISLGLQEKFSTAVRNDWIEGKDVRISLLYFFNLLVVTSTQRLSPRPMHVMILLITSVLGLPPKLDKFDNMLWKSDLPMGKNVHFLGTSKAPGHPDTHSHHRLKPSENTLESRKEHGDIWSDAMEIQYIFNVNHH